MISVAEMRGLICIWGKGKRVIGIFDRENSAKSWRMEKRDWRGKKKKKKNKKKEEKRKKKCIDL